MSFTVLPSADPTGCATSCYLIRNLAWRLHAEFFSVEKAEIFPTLPEHMAGSHQEYVQLVGVCHALISRFAWWMVHPPTGKSIRSSVAGAYENDTGMGHCSIQWMLWSSLPLERETSYVVTTTNQNGVKLTKKAMKVVETQLEGMPH